MSNTSLYYNKSALSEKHNQIFKKIRLTEEYSRDWKKKILCTG